jgi:hypothetical protein
VVTAHNNLILSPYYGLINFHILYYKRKFFSIKYQKYIHPDNKRFRNIAKDEAIYRLDESKKMNCPCLGHMDEREKLERFLKHLKINN